MYVYIKENLDQNVHVSKKKKKMYNLYEPMKKK